MSTHKKRPQKYPRWYVLARNAGHWVSAQLFFGMIAFLKLFPADAAINFIERMGRAS